MYYTIRHKNKCNLIHDAPIEPINPSAIKIIYSVITLIIKKIYALLKEAGTKVEKFVIEKIIENGKKILTTLKNKIDPLKVIKQIKKYSKELLNFSKFNIGENIKKIIKWALIMLDMANKQYKQKQESQEAKQLPLQLNTDSKVLMDLYKDSLCIINTLKYINKAVVCHKYIDDRRRISTTKTPTMWERKFVLGIKPGVQFNEKDWKAYKENGFIVMENKRTGQKYQKPQNEVVAAANAEREEKMIREDPYLKSGNIQYGDPSETPKTKRSLLQILKTIAATIAAVTVVVNEIKTLHTSSEGLRSILLNFANGAVTWLRNAKEAWKQVNNRVKT